MSTPKENFLRLMRNDNPTWLGDPWSCVNPGGMARAFTTDAVTLITGIQPGQVGVKNIWGVTMDWPEGHPGSIPHVTEENKVLKDITCWKDVVHFPDLEHLPWHVTDHMNPPLDRENKLVMVPSFVGLFEFSHFLMGFEDALMNYLEEPEAMYDLLGAYTDWKIQAIDKVIDHLHPDILHQHDDWGNKMNLFIPPTVWRELIKPHYKRFFDHVKSRGVMIQLHNDSVSGSVAEDMVELGIDMWQGVLPQDDIPGIIERTEGKLFLMGGIDMQKIDFPEATQEMVDAEVKRAIDAYMPLGHYMPCATSIIAVHPNVDEMLVKAMNKYGAEYAAKHF